MGAIDKLPSRTSQADDVVVTVLMSAENLAALERGVRGDFTELRLLKQSTGAYALAVAGRGERSPVPKPVNHTTTTEVT